MEKKKTEEMKKIKEYFKSRSVCNPEIADYFFIPINLVSFQFYNKNERKKKKRINPFKYIKGSGLGRRHHIWVCL